MFDHQFPVSYFRISTDQLSLKLSQAERFAEGMIYAENFENLLLQGSVTTAYRTAGYLWGGATPARMQVYELEFGQTAGLSSTDCQCQWDVSRFTLTALITATTVVSNLLDPNDTRVSANVYANAGQGDPAFLAAGSGLSVKNWAINQRGSYRWRALDDGDNLLVPATAQTGIAVRVLSSNFSGSGVGNISWVER